MELVRFPSSGGFSVRSIFVFVLSVVVTAFFWALLSSTGAHAADATWNGASLQYNSNQYISAGEAKSGDSIGLPEDTPYYVSTPATSTSSSQGATQKAFVIYFTPGTSPPQEINATYVEYTYTTRTGEFSSPTNKRGITVTPASQSSSGTSCAITGIGWIACPAMTWLASGMDGAFQLIAGFMEVQPLETGNSNSSLYQSWNVARSIANIAFIIAFLIIIYSQLTSIGVSNYGLKKLLPRLIIAAIGVNLSFIIAALAIDLSNVLGYSIQDLFTNLTQQVAASGGASGAGINGAQSWSGFVAFIISGGAAAAVGFNAALTATGGTFTALGFLLLPTLLALLLALLVAFVILAARQALIVILVIAAPLAVVAYILPNTEKWFDKWRGLLMTMLIFFPAFAFVFGGAQLAGSIIIMNATSVTMQLLGMTVQVAPLFITPLILKFSGSALGNIARIVNNPNKGLLDRTRKFSSERAEAHAKRGISGLDRKGNLMPGGLQKKNFARRAARRIDQRKRLNSDLTANAETATQTAYENSNLYNKNDMTAQKKAVGLEKEATHNRHEAHATHLMQTPGSMLHDRGFAAQTSKDAAETQQQRLSTYYNTQRVTPTSALNISNNALEVAKADTEASELAKTTYLNQQRISRATMLGQAAERLEVAKTASASAQDNYTAHIDNLKLGGNAALQDATKIAQVSKEQVQAAQHKVEAMLNVDRAVSGTALNASTINLKTAERDMNATADTVAKAVNDWANNPETNLHKATIRAEAAKVSKIESENALNKTIEEYKAGEYAGASIAGLETVMADMAAANINAAAQARGVQSAQNIQQKNIAEAFAPHIVDPDAPTPAEAAAIARSNQLLDMASSIDPNGRIRAQAAAQSAMNKIQREALDNNITLLGNQADDAGVNAIGYARSIFDQHVGANGATPVPQDPAILEAAMEMLARDGDINYIREAIMNPAYTDKASMNSIIARNEGTLKAKGGFDIQQKISKLWNASREEMDVSIANSLGAISAENVSGQKWGWWNSFVKEDKADPKNRKGLQRIMENVAAMPDGDDKEFSLKMLRSLYGNLTNALTSPEIMGKIGDRREDTGEMHKMLQDFPGLIDPSKVVDIDYELISQGIADEEARRRKKTP